MLYRKKVSLRLYLQIILGAIICFINLDLLLDTALMEGDESHPQQVAINQMTTHSHPAVAKTGIYSTFLGTALSAYSTTLNSMPIRQSRLNFLGGVLIASGGLITGILGLNSDLEQAKK